MISQAFNNNKNEPKLQKLKNYSEKYLKNLNDPNCLIEPLNSLCGGWSLQTFKQVINKLSTNRSSPLPLFFPTPDSMQLITKSKQLRQLVFQSFDTRGLKRIDACQLYCALMVVSKGSYEAFLKTIVDVFGFQYQSRIQKDEFFYFLDSFFRAVPKFVLIKGTQKPLQPNTRLQFQQIDNFVNSIFGEKQQIERNEMYQAMMKQQVLSEFVRYIQKKCNNCAQKHRNQIIEKANIEGEVRVWLTTQLQKIQQNEKKHINQEINKILE